MSRVLVTGGAGYIGSHVVKALGERGDTVLTVDNLSTGHRDAVLFGELAVGDIGDSSFLGSVLGEFRPDAVMHFAAFIEVGESVLDPLKYYGNNAVNAVRLLAAMERSGVRNVIFSSTAAVYGAPQRIPITEDQPIRPINPYGRAKAFVEQVMQDLAHAGSLHFVALRYFNAAGADAASRIGERHKPESHLIPRVLQAASGRLGDLAVYGTDYPTPDGTCIRDYVHVEDLAEAHLLALDHLLQGGESDVFNCGYGHGFSVQEVIGTARQVTGADLPFRTAPRRAGDAAVLVADSMRLKSKLNWLPRHDDLEYIIHTAWEWEKQRPAG